MDNETKWGGVWQFKCPECGGRGTLSRCGPVDDLMGQSLGSNINYAVACHRCNNPDGTITLPIEPAPGMLVRIDENWALGEWHMVKEFPGGILCVKGNSLHQRVSTPLLPSRAQLEAAGLSVDDGLDLLPWEKFGPDLIIPLKAGRLVRGKTIVRYEPGTALTIADDDAMRSDLDMHTALLAWAGVEHDA